MEGQGVISGWRSDGHVMEVVFRVTMVVVMVVEGLLLLVVDGDNFCCDGNGCDRGGASGGGGKVNFIYSFVNFINC